MEDYPEEHQQHAGIPPTDDTSSFENLFQDPHHHAASDSSIPLVQRESSLARIGNAFANSGLYAPTISAAPSASRGAPFYAPQPVHAGQPYVTAVNEVHSPPILSNPPVVPHAGARADIVHHSASYPPREQRPAHHRRRERERSEPPRLSVR